MRALRPAWGAMAACGGRPLELEGEPERRERRVGEQVAVEGVEHHRRVDARRRRRPRSSRSCRPRPPRRGCRAARPRLPTASATAGGRDEGADRAGGDEVVPAGVADARQRVVLGQDRRRGRSRCPPGAEGRRQPGDAALDRVPAARRELGRARRTPCAPRSGARGGRGCGAQSDASSALARRRRRDRWPKRARVRATWRASLR